MRKGGGAVKPPRYYESYAYRSVSRAKIFAKATISKVVYRKGQSEIDGIPENG